MQIPTRTTIDAPSSIDCAQRGVKKNKIKTFEFTVNQDEHKGRKPLFSICNATFISVNKHLNVEI